MKKVRLLLLLAVLALLPVTANAEDESVYVNLKGDSTLTFLFSEKPVLELGDSVVMRTTASTVKIAFADVESVTFTKKDTSTVQPTGIQSVRTTPKANVAFRIDNGGITVAGLAPGASVSVYTVSGAKVVSGKAASNSDSVFLPIDQNRPGVYIVRTSTGVSYKFLRK